MKRVWLGLIAAGVLCIPVWASEDIKLPVNLDKLAERASESVDVTLDESMLQLASKFLSKGGSGRGASEEACRKAERRLCPEL